MNDQRRRISNVWTAGREPRVITAPWCGYWAVRLVSGGPEVAASIQFERTTAEPGHPTNIMERSPILTARINGDIVTLEEVWTRRGRVISKDFHDWLVKDRAWARRHKPTDPAAKPRQPVNLRAIEPIMPPRRVP